jgi:hypothetical protein
VALQEERVCLIAQHRQLVRQREDVLHGTVVEIEAQAHQPPLARRHECLLACRVALEQVLAIQDGSDRCACHLEIRVGLSLPVARRARDDDGVEASEPPDSSRPDRGAADESHGPRP